MPAALTSTSSGPNASCAAPGGRQRLLAMGEVSCVREHGRALPPQILGPSLDPIGRGGDRDPRAKTRQQPRTGKADALGAAATADERSAPREVKDSVGHAISANAAT
jgi:hypothetical protein